MNKKTIWAVCLSALLLMVPVLTAAAEDQGGPGVLLHYTSSEAPTGSAAPVKQDVPVTAGAAVQLPAGALPSGQVQAETCAADPLIETSEDPRAALLAATKTAGKTDQIILVVDHNLTLWNKGADGQFRKALDYYCGYGRKGLKPAAERREGDETTPIGSFPILFAFGIRPNPGTQMTYRDVTPYSYWSGEEATYNTWVESPGRKVAGEHLINYDICYKYCMAIGFNTDPVVYKRGSAIFLHCKNPESWGSAGCVSLEDPDMIELLKACHDGVYMIIVPDTQSIAQF